MFDFFFFFFPTNVYLFLLFSVRWENDFGKEEKKKNNFEYIIKVEFKGLAMTSPLGLQKRMSKVMFLVTLTISNHQNPVKKWFQDQSKT